MKPKEILSYTFSALMLGCMLFVVAVLVQWEFFTPKPQRPQPLETRSVQNWKKLKFQGFQAGPATASVQIVEFFDYQCPFCKAAQPAVKAIQRKYPGKVAVVHENFPLTHHQYAFDAAIASECARRQHAFMGYHDALFASQNRLGNISYTKLAARVGVADTVAFHRCLAKKKTTGIVKSGQALGDTLNIHGIPTFLINGRLVSGVLSTRQLDGLVRQTLAEAAK